MSAPGFVDVATSYGPVRGVAEHGIPTFRGIPYGAPTSGANRFRPPRPPEPWDEPRRALLWGPIAPQLGGSAESYARTNDRDAYVLYRGVHSSPPGEDCLRLNVWTPDVSGSHPVFVYLHGGGLVGGSGHDLLAYDGAHLAARHDVVVINGQHRLGAFGFLDVSRTLPGHEDAANLGLQDLVALLQWVRDNAAAFGGDPHRVTICGQSGGGIKVSALMSMPSAQGLFHRAIIQSGSMTRTLSPDEADAQVATLLDGSGLTPHDLLTVDVDDLLAATRGFGLMDWRPVLDGTVLSEPLLGDPSSTVTDPLSAHVPVIIGSNRAEFVTALDDPRADGYTSTDLAADAAELLGAAATHVVARLRAIHPDASPFEIFAALKGFGMRTLARAQLDAKARQGGTGYGYLFAWNTPVLGGGLGTFHSAEIAFVHDNADLCVRQTGATPRALELATDMAGRWTAFARSGVPDVSGGVGWDTWNDARATMIFGEQTRCVPRLDDDIAEPLAALAGPF